MICYKKIMVVCVLSWAGFLGAMEIYHYGNIGAAEEMALKLAARGKHEKELCAIALKDKDKPSGIKCDINLKQVVQKDQGKIAKL